MKQDNNLIKTKISKYRLQKVFVNDDEIYPEKCPECEIKGYENCLRFLYINYKEAVYKCPSAKCLYPNKRFIYKNYNNNTKYRYIRIKDCNYDINNFNINFLDDNQNYVSHDKKETTTETTINEFIEKTIIPSDATETKINEFIEQPVIAASTDTETTINPYSSTEETEKNTDTTLTTSSIEKPIIASLDFLSVAEEASITFSLNSIINPLLLHTDTTVDSNNNIINYNHNNNDNNNNNYMIFNHQCDENNIKNENAEILSIYQNNNIMNSDLNVDNNINNYNNNVCINNDDENVKEYINLLNDKPSVNNDNDIQSQGIYVNELDALLDSLKSENYNNDNEDDTFDELLNDIFDDSNNFKKDEINVNTNLKINPFGVTNDVINNGKIITTNHHNITPKRLAKCMNIIMNEKLNQFKKITRKHEKRKKVSAKRTLTLLNAVHLAKPQVT